MANDYPTRAQRGAALFLGIIPGAIGLNALMRPAQHLASIDLPLPTAPSDRLTAFTLLYIFGVRQLFMTGTIGLGVALGNRIVLGGLMLLASGVAAGDAAVVWAMGQIAHVAPSVVVSSVIAATGLWILRG